MWKSLAKFVLKNRLLLLILLFSATIFMGYFASKVKLSYEFSKAIPTNNPKYEEYLEFKKLFGDDGNMLVIGVQTKNFFNKNEFHSYQILLNQIKKVKCVDDVLSVPGSLILIKDSISEKLKASKIFADNYNSQSALDSAQLVFKSLPFYKSMLYNSDAESYLMAVKINKDSLSAPVRVEIVNGIIEAVKKYEQATGNEAHLSGLPLIRTIIAERIQNEMKLFLLASLALSVLILFMFFRSISTTLISISVVLIGVIWTIGLIYLFGYKITLLTALIPSLVVVIGIPNCIYFINKFHTSYSTSVNEENDHQRKNKALLDMVSKMGVVTLFCNITAAIGFAVFALTKSPVLKEFGIISGISIMLIFIISFILLPAVLSYLPSPNKNQLRYLDNKWVILFLNKIEIWVFAHRKSIIAFTSLIVVISIAGIIQLKSVAFIVDDLPKSDKIYADLKFFEKNFKGIMPLEILIDCKKRNGLAGMKSLTVFEKVDSLSSFISSKPELNRPLSIAEGLKFAKQAFYENDSSQYLMPNSFDGAFVGEYLKPAKNEKNGNDFSKMLNSFVDTGKRYARISVSMADIGTEKLPIVLQDIQNESNRLFDTSSYKVSLTGTSITFLEGSRFIINGLKESIFWAFLLIAFCMLYLFKSFRILLCSLIPNIIPLVVTAGVMGWAGVPLKPSTVLVFSVALGIAIDITIRFLVNYKQLLPMNNQDVEKTVKSTVQQTGLSIIYTSLVLTAGFIIFCASTFGGTFALGWLTSVTLFTATLTNLVFLPVLLLIFNKSRTQ